MVTDILDVSVAISTMERAEALARCLDSIAAGSRQPAEVVIVDQSRDDHTRELVEARGDRPLRIVYVRQEPRGLGASQNEAVRLARSPIVAVTDDDCIVDTEWIATVHGVLSASDGPDVLAGRVLPLPPTGERIYPVSSRVSEVSRDFDRKGLPWDVGSGNNFAFRRDWFLRVGGCDERLGPGSPARGGVDMDLFYRLMRAGAGVRYEPAALVYHERETWEGRRTRRPMYGRGMGAACGMRLREGDVGALGLLGKWMVLRASRIAKSVRAADARGVQEEMLMLGGTATGLLHGLRAGRRRPGDE